MVTGKLTAKDVQHAKPGLLGDGGGLWLQATPAGKSWTFRYTSPVSRKPRQMGLGALAVVSLAEAREAATAARKLVAAGRDPIDERDGAKAAARAAAAQATAEAVTFRDAAERYIAAHQAGWRSAKHATQWAATLAAHAYPHIGTMPVASIGTEDVRRVLDPIWQPIPETAGRVRGRIEMVLDYAKVSGWRDGENPARWRGHLALMLPARGKLAPVEHHPALPWQEAPSFLAQLSAIEAMGALALRFAILTAARSGEVRGAAWGEINMTTRLWTVPASRMKAGREHRVPLSDAAIAILDRVAPLAAGPDALIFPGMRKGQPLSDMTLTAVLRRMNRGDLTAHGFRSTFRDWASEATAHPPHAVELALAHAVGNKVEAAYRRGDMLEKRRALMDDWATYLAGVASADAGAPAAQLMAAE